MAAGLAMIVSYTIVTIIQEIPFHFIAGAASK